MKRKKKKADEGAKEEEEGEKEPRLPRQGKCAAYWIIADKPEEVPGVSIPLQSIDPVLWSNMSRRGTKRPSIFNSTPPVGLHKDIPAVSSTQKEKRQKKAPVASAPHKLANVFPSQTDIVTESGTSTRVLMP